MTLNERGRYPEGWPVPTGYDRHRPSVSQTRSAMELLVAHTDWGTASWSRLADDLVSLGRTDIPLSRLTEGHVDAMRILAEADRASHAGSLYAVWASRSQRTGLAARSTDEGWRLSGTLRFASGAGVVDRALVPVWPHDGEHVLLDLDLTGWVSDESSWKTRAMEVSRSHTYVIDDLLVPRSAQVGAPGFYLGRPGFFAGGVGVAAVWAGGGARLLDLVLAYRSAAPPSVSATMRVGLIRTELAAAHALVTVAGQLLESGAGGDTRRLATLTRTGVAAAVARVIGHVRHLAGPAGLVYAEDLTRAIDDLDLYTRQLNSDADAEYLGALAG